MRIVYFSQKDQLRNYLLELGGQVQLVAPSPAKADSLRLQISGELRGDVITIAKFTSDLLGALWEGEEKPPVKRKAELLLIFGMMKSRLFPDLGYEQFMQAYNLFSELRSFSLDFEALSSVMEAQPQVIKDAVAVFWRVLEGTGFLDEHGAYQAIAERLRSAEEIEELKKNFVFWGFQHLNGQQIDLLKALAIRYPVIIPFPVTLKDKIKRSDWLSWLKDHKVEEVELEALPTKPRGMKVEINSREIALALKERLPGHTQVILGVSKLGPSHIDLLPTSSVNFKVPYDLIGGEILSVFTRITEGLSKEATGEEFLSFLEEEKRMILKSLGEGEVEFKKLKALQLYEEAFASIASHTDESIQVNDFYQKLLRDVALLNQPRTSLTPLLSNQAQVELKDMSSLQDIPDGASVILCIDERFEDIQGLGPNYSEKVQKELSGIGPLKRNELDLLFRQWEFENLFTRSVVTVLMPGGILKHNLVWKRMFQNIHLDSDAAQIIPPDRILQDHLARVEKKSFESTFSASRLQSYLECPRKFYFKFVEKISPQIVYEKDIDSLLAGTIGHKIIEIANKRKIPLEEISQLTTEILNFYIQKNQLHLPREVYLEKHLVFRQRSSNGLEFLQDIATTVAQPIEWEMEVDFSLAEKYELKGTIDCIGVTQDFLFLLDFKTSTSSASKASELENFTSLQLWIYALAIRKMRPEYANKKLVMGYVVLNKPEDSNLMMFDADTYSMFAENRFSTLKHMKESSLDEYLSKAQETVDTLALNIQQDKEFPVRPLNMDACTYCELSRICVKGAANVTNS